MASSIKSVKLKIDPVANKGKIKYLELTRDMINLEMDFYNKVIIASNLDLSNSAADKKLERLTHRTKTNHSPAFPIDKHMLPSPSIMKRSIIASSIGQMKSYMTKLNVFKESGSKKGMPGLPTPSTMPTFYYSDISLNFKDIKNQFISLRVFTNGKWEFVNYPVKFTNQFLTKYAQHEKWLSFNDTFKTIRKEELISKGLTKKEAGKITKDKMGNNPYYKMLSPSLCCKKGVWYLTFPFEKQVFVKSVKRQLEEETLNRTLAVDLGINHLAVITIKEGNKLLKTKFISGKKINGLRHNALKKISFKQKQSGRPVKGERSNKKLWSYVLNLNEDTAHQVSADIVKLAKEYNCQVIIFENLNNFSAKGVSGSARLNLKLNYWLCGKIVDYTKYKAFGERILTVERNPFMTSQIYYKTDMPGERFSPGKQNGKSLILFEDGKVLNADFNASLNLHRKFYREFPRLNLKEVKAKQKLIKKLLDAS